MIFTLFVHLLLTNSVRAFEKFRHYDSETGLGFTSVTDIKQDQLGFIWVSSQDGISRYDGYKFKLHKRIPGDKNSLIDNFIWQMKLDGNNGLWIASRTGFSHYITESGNFINRSSYVSASTSEHAVTTLALSPDKQLWLGTEGEGLQHFNPQTKQLSRIDKSAFLPGDYINTILAEKDRLWLGSGPVFLRDRGEAGFIQYDIINNVFKAYPVPFSSGISQLRRSSRGYIWIATFGDGLWKFDTLTENFIPVTDIPNKEIISLHEDKKQNLWIGTSSGLYKLANNQLTAIAAEARIGSGPGTRIISALTEDKSGNLWIGTWTDGLYQMNLFDNGIRSLQHQSDDNSITTNEVVSMTTTDNKELWIGLWRSGVDRFDSTGRKIAHYSHDAKNPFSLTPGNIRQVHIDQQKQLWISTSLGLNKYNKQQDNFQRYSFQKNKTNGVCGPKIISLSSSIDGLWLGTRGDGACFLPYNSNEFIHYHSSTNDENHLSHNSVSVIFPDENGIWMGTEGGGLNYLDKRSNKFIHYSKNNASYFVAHDNITAIHKDNNNQLWVGTQGGGISIFQLHADKTPATYKKTLTTIDGLTSDAISAIFEDEKGYIWVGTSHGISKINPSDMKIKQYETNFIFLIGSGYQSENGTLYLGGVKGLKYFHPNHIKENENIPAIVLTEFRLINDILKPEKNGLLSSSIELAKNITIPYQRNMFTVSFSALDFQAPELNQYKYRLQGFDDNWIESNSDRHFATYTNLPAGRYRLQVIGSNNDGVWNLQGRNLNILVETPPWTSIWAILGYSILILILFTYLIWEYRQRRQMNLSYNDELKDTEERLMLSLWGSGNELWDWDMITAKVIQTNKLPLQTFPKHLLNGRLEHLKSFIHKKDVHRVNQAYTLHRSNRKPRYECSYRIRDEKGEWVWVLDKGKIVTWNANGNPLRMAGTLENINSMKSTEQRLNIIAKSLENTADGIWITDQNFNFIFINKTFTKITGNREDDVIHNEFHFENIYNQNRTFEEHIKQYLLSNGHWQGEIWDQRENGEKYLQQLNIDCLRDNNGNITHFIGVFSDITHRKNSEQELYKLAKYDRLTSLLNNSEFIIQLEQQITLIDNKQDSHFALVFIGIDKFSTINEYFGLDAGDHVIRETANRIKSTLSNIEIIARFSGDEFVILFPELANDPLDLKIRKLRSSLSELFFFDNNEIQISCSIGVSLFPQHGTHAKQLFGNAYRTMSRLKNSTGDNIQFFNEEILTKTRINHQHADDLKNAIDNGELELHFQPCINLEKGEVDSIETLLRWNNPTRGLLMPENILPLAETASLIHQISDWVFEQAFQAKQTTILQTMNVPISLRISAQQLRQPGFSEKFATTLNNASISSQQIQLIIEESELVDRRLTSRQNLEIIYQLDTQISLANFGTTESSLEWLQQNYISSVRLSKNLISKLESENANKEMIQALLNMASKLSIKSIAEGVEKKSQYQWLKNNNCISASGPYFAKPMTLKQLIIFLEPYK